MSFDVRAHATRVRLARLAGVLYLTYIAASVLADQLGHIGLGTAREVYDAVLRNPALFRAALVVALVSGLLFALVAWGLYVLLRPVNRDLAVLFLVLNIVGVAISGASMIPLVSAMLQGGAAGDAFSSAQLAGLGVLSASTYKTGFVTAQLFFGAWLFPLGYLVYKSGFLPRTLGVLLLLDGVAVLIWFLQAMMFPAYRAVSTPGLVVSFFAEFGLGVWLAVKGVKPPEDVSEVAPRSARPQLTVE